MQEPIAISIIIPAYQEQERIGHTIEQYAAYLEVNHPGAELILVCDGCSDQTAAVARQAFKAPSCQLRIIELPNNRGKGNAVKTGMLAASGNYLFFTDADLSFAPQTMEPFIEKLNNGADLAIAQRRATATYTEIGRRSLAILSRAIIGNIILPGIRDTQAGFKAFRHQAAKFLFSQLKTPGYLFDLEILLAARRHGYHIEKVYVDWCDRPGSKVNLVKDALKAALDLILICLRHCLKQLLPSNHPKQTL